MSLRPQSTLTRSTITLDGPWLFQPDFTDEGEAAGWSHGLPAPRPIAVPASWNDQYADLARFFGAGWYQTRLLVRAEDLERVVHLRLGAAFYHGDVWLDGIHLGRFEGGYLPSVFDLTGRARREGRLVIRVDGRLSPESVPSAGMAFDPRDMFGSHDQGFPRVSFDFFPYCGLNRPVQLAVLPHRHLVDLTVVTEPAEPGVRVRVAYTRSDDPPCACRCGWPIRPWR